MMLVDSKMQLQKSLDEDDRYSVVVLSVRGLDGTDTLYFMEVNQRSYRLWRVVRLMSPQFPQIFCGCIAVCCCSNRLPLLSRTDQIKLFINFAVVFVI